MNNKHQIRYTFPVYKPQWVQHAYFTDASGNKCDPPRKIITRNPSDILRDA